MELENFLDAKPLFYDEIDYDRFPKIYHKIKHHFTTQKIIHIIGTNGKGTTGRFLASALYNIGYKVGHYTSPHISQFNERVWIDGCDAKNSTLDNAHKKLQTLLDKDDSDALSYFEYTTLIAMLVFENCEYVVLEAGLGGEYDATAIFDKILTLVTPIDIDHEAFLGSNITEIATTKLNAIQNYAIVTEQKYDEVYTVVQSLLDKKSLQIKRVVEFIDKDDAKKISNISNEMKLAVYLEKNLMLSIAALKFLEIKYSKKNFKDSQLFGRLTRLCDNVIIDVGHNTLAAHSIVSELSPNKYVLIYNSYKDKNYKEILQILKPIIKYVEIIDIDDQRVVSLESLQKTLIDLKIEYTKYYKTKKNNNYLVFGSFSVAQSFLREYNG